MRSVKTRMVILYLNCNLPTLYRVSSMSGLGSDHCDGDFEERTEIGIRVEQHAVDVFSNGQWKLANGELVDREDDSAALPKLQLPEQIASTGDLPSIGTVLTSPTSVLTPVLASTSSTGGTAVEFAKCKASDALIANLNAENTRLRKQLEQSVVEEKQKLWVYTDRTWQTAPSYQDPCENIDKYYFSTKEKAIEWAQAFVENDFEGEDEEVFYDDDFPCYERYALSFTPQGI